MSKRLKHYPKKEITEEDFEKADKILKAMVKVSPPKNWKDTKKDN